MKGVIVHNPVKLGHYLFRTLLLSPGCLFEVVPYQTGKGCIFTYRQLIMVDMYTRALQLRKGDFWRSKNYLEDENDDTTICKSFEVSSRCLPYSRAQEIIE